MHVTITSVEAGEGGCSVTVDTAWGSMEARWRSDAAPIPVIGSSYDAELAFGGEAPLVWGTDVVAVDEAESAAYSVASSGDGGLVMVASVEDVDAESGATLLGFGNSKVMASFGGDPLAVGTVVRVTASDGVILYDSNI